MNDSISSEVPRFRIDSLEKMIRPSVRHFTPVEGDRDRFGNRIFSSPRRGLYSYRLGYRDREGQETRAAILISPAGERFIKDNKWILDDIDRGLTSLTEGGFDVNLGNSRSLHYKGDRGGQSRVYILRVDGEKYAVKSGYKRKFMGDVSQPYFNEMLQAQAIQTDLAKEWKHTGFCLPTYLFASGQVLCRSYEEGFEPADDADFRKKLDKLFTVVHKYVDERKLKKDKLWKNIDMDIADFFSRSLRTSNFVQKPDGTLSWIDPFMYVG